METKRNETRRNGKKIRKRNGKKIGKRNDTKRNDAKTYGATKRVKRLEYQHETNRNA